MKEQNKVKTEVLSSGRIEQTRFKLSGAIVIFFMCVIVASFILMFFIPYETAVNKLLVNIQISMYLIAGVSGLYNITKTQGKKYINTELEKLFGGKINENTDSDKKENEIPHL